MQEKSKILPVKYPMITSYPRYANFFSIIQNNKLQSGWFYENYIQLQINNEIEKKVRLEFHAGYDAITILKNCPAISYTLFQRELIEKSYADITDFIIDYIDKGYHLYFLVDMSSVSNYKKNEKLNHDIMIYGYDRIKKIFYASDFFFRGKYSFENVSFDDIRNAYDNINLTDTEFDWLHGIIGFKLDTDYIHRINIKKIKRNLLEYMDGINPSIHNEFLFEYMNLNDYSFGINIYSRLDKYLKHMCKRNENTGHANELDLRPFHMLYDHKEILLRLTEYLSEEAYLGRSERIKYSAKIKNLQYQTLVLRNSAIKYNRVRNSDIMSRCLDYLSEIKKDEEMILKELYANISEQKIDIFASVNLNKPQSSVEFIGSDEKTKGDFNEKYGKDGYDLCYISKLIPDYAGLYIKYNYRYCNTNDTDDMRALKDKETNSRFSASYVGSQNIAMDIDIFIDGESVRCVSFYLLDWYQSKTPMRIKATDKITGETKHETIIDDCGQGIYMTYKVSGRVTFQMIPVKDGDTPFFSGVFFD